MYKRVTPVEPTASIPDPHRGDCLPPEGRVVAWNAYWAGLAAREEISVADEPEAEDVVDASVLALPAPSEPAPPAEG